MPTDFARGQEATSAEAETVITTRRVRQRSASRALGYLRVSTDDQAESGLGLDAQRTAIEAAAARLELLCAEIFTDAGVSGGLELEKRPALMQAVSALRRGDVLIVAKRDRLGRDVLHVALLQRLVEQKGARIVSAAGEGTDGDNAAAQLMRVIVDAFAQYERALISERTKAALAAKKARGELVGAVPYGFVLSGTLLVEDAREQAALAMMRDCRARGLTCRETADELNAAGFATRTGGRWWQSYVSRLERRHQ